MNPNKTKTYLNTLILTVQFDVKMNLNKIKIIYLDTYCINSLHAMLSDTVGSDSFRLSDIVGSYCRNPTVSNCRKASEINGYSWFPTVGTPSDPTVGKCRIIMDPMDPGGEFRPEGYAQSA